MPFQFSQVPATLKSSPGKPIVSAGSNHVEGIGFFATIAERDSIGSFFRQSQFIAFVGEDIYRFTGATFTPSNADDVMASAVWTNTANWTKLNAAAAAIAIADVTGLSGELSSLSSDISTNTSGISTNTSGISTNATGISTNAAGISSSAALIATNITNIATNTSGVSTNASGISTNTSGISTNTSGISTNASAITAVEGDVSTNAADISTNTSGISTNATGISTNASGISTNASDIADNVTDIATNTSGVSTNASGISTNASGISTNTSGISTNTSDIATNAADIATNTSGISTNASGISTNASGISTNVTAIATKADTSSLGTVATSNDYGDLSNLPTLGTAAAAATGDFAAASHTHVIGDVTGLQAALDNAGDANVQSDWDETDSSADSFILNKPTIAGGFSGDYDDLTDKPDLSVYATESDLSTAEGLISGNTTDIATNTSDISTNATGISTNASGISTNATGISTNASDITAVEGDVATNTSAISTNASGISTNATGISTNVSGISTNASDITAVEGDVATNTSSISTNTSGISTNASGISTNASGISTNASAITGKANTAHTHNKVDILDFDEADYTPEIDGLSETTSWGSTEADRETNLLAAKMVYWDGTAYKKAPVLSIWQALAINIATNNPDLYDTQLGSSANPADIDGDGTVGVSDILAILANYGNSGEFSPSKWFVGQGVLAATDPDDLTNTLPSLRLHVNDTYTADTWTVFDVDTLDSGLTGGESTATLDRLTGSADTRWDTSSNEWIGFKSASTVPPEFQFENKTNLRISLTSGSNAIAKADVTGPDTISFKIVVSGYDSSSVALTFADGDPYQYEWISDVSTTGAATGVSVPSPFGNGTSQIFEPHEDLNIIRVAYYAKSANGKLDAISFKSSATCNEST